MEMTATNTLAEALAEVMRGAIAEAMREYPAPVQCEAEDGLQLRAERVYTAGECAKVMRTNREQVYAWIRSGELAAFHLNRDAQKWMVYGGDLLKLIDRLKSEY